jgi:phosphoglycerate dehydrogenase-like enzyme
MSDQTDRRELLLAGLAATAAAATPAFAQPGRYRIALTGDFEDMAARAAPWTSLGEDIEVVAFNKALVTPQETVRALRDFDAVVLMRERTALPREVLEQLPRLKLIIFSGRANALLHHKTTLDRNIFVANAANLSDEEGGPAELTLGLMLACAWHIPQANALVRSGGWSMQPAIPIKIPLAGRTLGIPGYGAIGTRVGKLAQALGMKVLGFSRTLTEDIARADNVRKVELDELMSTSDVVSVHLPLTAETKGMIGAKQIGMLKRGAIFINTARGPIVDETALIGALRSRQIAMAGIDVFDVEPLPRNHPFNSLPNVVMTPHIGYVSEGAMTAWYKGMFDVLAAYRQGKAPRFVPTERDLAG